MNNNMLTEELPGGDGDVLRFEMDDIDSKYGRATNIVGEVPFVGGSAAKCEQDYDRLIRSPKLDHIIGECVRSYRDLWPQFTDDEIFERMRASVVSSGIMFGCEDAADPRFRFIAHLSAIGWALDDMGDGGGDEDDEEERRKKEEATQDEATKWAKVKREYRMVIDVFRDQPMPTLDKFPNVSAKYAPLREAIATFNQVAYETFPNFTELYGLAYKDEMLCFLESVMLNRGLKSLPASSALHYCSPATYADMDHYLGGVPLVLEVYGIMYGVVVPNKIRRDVLFQLVYNRVCDVWATVNPVVGLVKDLREGQTDSALFIKIIYGGKTLQEAVDTMFVDMRRNLADYRTLRTQLLDIFDDEPSVVQFVHNCDTLVNGMLYFFATTERYGVKGKLRVTKSSGGAT